MHNANTQVITNDYNSLYHLIICAKLKDILNAGAWLLCYLSFQSFCLVQSTTESIYEVY